MSKIKLTVRISDVKIDIKESKLISEKEFKVLWAPSFVLRTEFKGMIERVVERYLGNRK